MKKIPNDYYEIRKKALSLLGDIHKRAGNADGKHPTYVDIKCDIVSEEDVELFCFWYYQELKRKLPKYPKNTIFTIDRINNMGYYTLNNLQLISIQENEMKKALDHAIQYCGREPHKDEKYCHSCHTIKKRTEFFTDNKEVDGLRSNCKECFNKSNNKSRKRRGNRNA